MHDALLGMISKQQPQPQQQPLLHPIQVAASANWKLDDDGGSGMHMNSQSRVALMAKLGQTAGVNVPTLPQQPVVAPQVQVIQRRSSFSPLGTSLIAMNVVVLSQTSNQRAG